MPPTLQIATFDQGKRYVWTCVGCRHVWHARDPQVPSRSCPRCRRVDWRDPRYTPVAMVAVAAWRCERCQHVWLPRDHAAFPYTCPGCRSAYWDRPRQAKARRHRTPPANTHPPA